MIETASSTSIQTTPFLEHYPEAGESPHRILLESLPFRIGRLLPAHHVIYSRQVSKEHCEIYRMGDQLWLRDLGSTNGTYVNGERIDATRLLNGDIIHVAHHELRFCSHLSRASDESQDACTTDPKSRELPTSVFRNTTLLREMLEFQYVNVVFQPIVSLQTRSVLGYEALGRGTHAELSSSPSILFGLAHVANLATDLSHMFRRIAAVKAAALPVPTKLFINLHPSELADKSLLTSLAELKNSFKPGQDLVVEVHESVVTNLNTFTWLRGQLTEMGIGIAYDDFGVGQARLAELAEVPPDYLKLDKNLVQNIDRAPHRAELVQALNRVIVERGVQTIAEGIERKAEAETCLQLGCQFGQGFYFGYPQPASVLALTDPGLKTVHDVPDR